MHDPEKPLNVDFVSLAIKYPDFGDIYASSEGRIDFQDPVHLKYLSPVSNSLSYPLTFDIDN